MSKRKFYLSLVIYLVGLFSLTFSASAVDYTYDDSNRLIMVTYDNGQVLHYSYDANGNLIRVISGPDNVAPSVTITSPEHDSELGVSGGTVTIKTNATDNVKVAKVNFYIDDVYVGQRVNAPYTYNWISTAGVHTVMAKVYDTTGNVGISDIVTVKVPANITVTSPLAESTVSGSINSFTAVSDGPLLGWVVLSIDGVAVDSVNLTTPATSVTYDYIWDTTQYANGTIHEITVTGHTLSGHIFSLRNINVTVNNPIVDTPSVRITSPVNNSTLEASGSTVAVTANATDNVGVSRVDFYVDNVYVGQSVNAPYTYNWISKAGIHTVMAKVYDTTGNVGISDIVTVNVPANIIVTSPLAGSTVSGSIDSFTAVSDGPLLGWVVLAIDGVAVDSVNLTTPATSVTYDYIWDTTQYANGTIHEITVTGHTLSGHIFSLRNINVTVNNPIVDTPSVRITSPVNNSTLEGSGSLVAVTANATDNVGVSRVDFYVDNVYVGQSVNAPYTYNWISTVGVHTVSAVVYDTAGNYGVSNSVVVTVPAKVTVTGPAVGSTVGGTVMTFTANSSEPLVGWAFLYIDGEWKKSLNLEIPTTNLSLNYFWDTRQYADGTSHSISIAGRTVDGNLWSESAKIWVTVDNSIPIVDTTAPVVNIISPMNGGTAGPSGEIVPISVDVADNVGVTRVDYYIDNTKVGQEVYAPFTFNWLATIGNHTVSAVVYDATGNYGVSNSVAVTVPAKVTVTGPVAGSTVGGTVMTFTASSSEPLVGWAFLYIDGEWKKSLNLETPTTNLTMNYLWDTRHYANGTSHSISIAGRTVDGNLWSESVKIWVTVDNSIPIVDTTAPVVNIISPMNGGTAGPSGETVPISVDVADNVGVTRVDYYIDNTKVGEAVYAPFTFNWLATIGSHTVSAVVYDAAGNYGVSSSVAVTVPAKVTVTGPAAGSMVGGTVMTFTASSSEPLVGWAFLYIDGEWKKSLNLETPTTNLTMNYLWDTRHYANGTSHSISIAGRTVDGNLWSESAKIWVTVDNSIPIVDTTAPVVNIISPMNGGTAGPSGEIVPISVDVADNVGVTRVDYYIDNTKVGEAVYAPFTFNWLATIGNHTVSAVVYDAAGNYGVSSDVVTRVPAKITITSPVENSTVTGVVQTITADFSDPVTGWTYLYIDGDWVASYNVGTSGTNATFTANWNTRLLNDGSSHYIEVAGTTVNGNLWSVSKKTYVTVYQSSVPSFDSGFLPGPLKLTPMAFYYGDLTNVRNMHDPEYSKEVLSKFPYVICAEPGEISPAAQDVVNAIKDTTNLFGYVSFNGSATDVVELKTKIDRMAGNGYYGVFIDQFGYDWGNYRVTQNEVVDYAHSKGLKVFVNAWFVDDALGNVVDAVYNPTGIESHITAGDWYLGESFYVSTLGYYGISAQIDKYLKMSNYQKTLGVNMVGLSYKRNEVTWEDSQNDIAASYVLAQLLGFKGWWFTSEDIGDGFLYGKDPQIDIGNAVVTPLHLVTDGKYIAQTDTKTIEFNMVDNLLSPVLPFGATSEDTSTPVISITSPSNNAEVGPSGKNVLITVNAVDNVGVTRVDYYIDNTKVGEEVYAPFTFYWLATVGNHTVTAVVYDAAGNYGISNSVAVKVPAQITITSPVENSSVSGVVTTITANFSDPVTGWTFLYIDGDWVTSYNVGDSSTSAIFTPNWDTRLLVDGSNHYIEVAGTTINGGVWSVSKKTYVTIDQSIGTS